MREHLRPFDLAILAAYLIAITLFGLRFLHQTQPSPHPSDHRPVLTNQ
jgi:hypothetical protein